MFMLLKYIKYLQKTFCVECFFCYGLFTRSFMKMLNSPTKSIYLNTVLKYKRGALFYNPIQSHYSRFVGLATQSEDTHGISKTVFTHISRLHGLLNDWIRVRDKGTKLCKAVIALKLHECTDDYYPHQLQPLSESLLEVLESLNDIVEGVMVVTKQLQALAKLQQVAQPVIFTWTAKDISDNVHEVCNTLQQEYRLKTVVVENIAHCRDEKLLEVYATAWEIDTYFRVESTAYLFSEVGLSPV